MENIELRISLVAFISAVTKEEEGLVSHAHSLAYIGTTSNLFKPWLSAARVRRKTNIPGMTGTPPSPQDEA